LTILNVSLPLVNFLVFAATGTRKKEVTLDPCTPKGYAENASSLNLSRDSLAQKYSSTFHAAGNFSECKTAALRLLQRGKGSQFFICSH